MVNQAIVKWLKQYLNQGYGINSLRSSLLQHGYSKKDIEEAIAAVYGPSEVRHTIHLSKTTFGLAIAIIFTIIIATAGFFYFNSTRTPSTLLDVRTELLSSIIEPGEKLNFNLELTSLGSSKRYDVDVRYVIEKDGKQITFKEETVGLETSKSYKTFIEIPPNVEAGNYILRTTASYDGKTARATSSFQIRVITAEASCYDSIRNQDETDVDCGGSCEACPTCFDNKQNQNEEGIDCGGSCEACPEGCDDNNRCTTDQVIDGVCTHDPIIPCCGDNVCDNNEIGGCLSDCPSDDIFAGMNVWEKLEKIEQIAEVDDSQAEIYCNTLDNSLHIEKCLDNIARASKDDSYCDKIEDERTREECYIAVAKESSDKSICTKITKETRMNRCYMHFATAGIDYTVCEEITDYYLKQLCDSMKSLEENQAES